MAGEDEDGCGEKGNAGDDDQEEEEGAVQAEAVRAPRRKWEGRLHAVVEAPMERVWAVASDCCGLPRWMQPMVERCEGVAGEPGQPGFVRRLSGEMFPAAKGADDEKSWIRERLLLMDADRHVYAYAMEDGNVGLSGYVNTVHFSEFDEGATLVDWSFQVDPVPGGAKEDVLDYLGFLYKTSLKRLELVAKSPCSPAAPRPPAASSPTPPAASLEP